MSESGRRACAAASLRTTEREGKMGGQRGEVDRQTMSRERKEREEEERGKGAAACKVGRAAR